jgi:hypothetical protein
MDTALLALTATFFLGMGLLGLVAPGRLVAPFRIVLDGPDARAEVRAVYGGFGLGVAALLGAAVFDLGDLRRGAAIAVAVALLGMAFGRAISRFVERPVSFYPIWFYFWVEVIGGGLLLLAVA